jgi:tellurite resistance protein
MTRETDLKKDAARLVEAFFAGENAGLLEELRRKTEEDERRKMLREVVKIQDEAFLSRLVALGLSPETALAIALIPLVFVAWADGRLDDREREAILEAARERGVTAGRIGRQLLKDGLARKPDPRLLSFWKTYVGRLWGCFTADERWQMRRNVLQSAREVAEAAGGILGLTSKISAEERRVLEDLEKMLD